MTALLWIIQKLAPITSIVGLLYLLSALANGNIEPYMYILAGALALVGLAIGFTNWALEIPPKFFWTKSRVELFDNRVGNAFGYAVIFFLLPFFVAAVIVVVERIG